jgi:hypothetical protein
MAHSVGIVIPAYNPDPSILNEYVKGLKSDVADTVHIELDAPADATVDSLTHHDSLNIAPTRRGKGRAITDGFNTLSTDILAFADADGSVDCPSVEAVLQPVRQGTADVAIGSRRHPDAVIKSHQTRLRRRMGDVFAWLTRHLLPITLYDYQCGMKALSATAWDELSPHLYETGFAWDLEVLAMADVMEYTIDEVPVTWDDDPVSTVDPLSTAVNMATALVAIRHRTKVIEGSTVHSALARVGEHDTVTSSTTGDD